ncbi:MAG TPA: lipopolysaccharide kinase InaA family protein [Gemmataceae bacterium]|jgi:tRNA A-37 threonylcarbamoyl transferase component Bud32
MRVEPTPTAAAGRAAPTAAGWVIVRARYRRRFARWGLVTAGDFLGLPGEVVSGHADRHAVHVFLGRGRKRLAAFLKREHRVRWRDRLAAAWAGYGWASKSEREARLLSDLRRAGVPVPRWLAYGEDDHGRAFVLVRAVPRAVDLRAFLHGDGDRPPTRRRGLARRLGCLLARVHAAGFDCPDLSSKHVLVRPRRPALVLIDWQRARRTRRVSWAVRVRELAALHATVADELASPRERLSCLRSYLRAAVGRRPTLRCWVEVIDRYATRLLRRGSVRELRRPPLPRRAQWLRWLDGERLVVTRSFWRTCRGRVPAWLADAARTPVTQVRQSEGVWRGRQVVLRRFPPHGILRRFWNWLRGRHEVAAGPREGGRLFRLERLGIPAPRPLAFGQRPDGGSFIAYLPNDDR